MADTPIPLLIIAKAIAAASMEDQPTVGTTGAQVVLVDDSGVDLGYDATDLLHVWFHFDGPEPGDCVEMVFRPLYTRDEAAIADIAHTIVRHF